MAKRHFHHLRTLFCCEDGVDLTAGCESILMGLIPDEGAWCGAVGQAGNVRGS